MLFVQTDRYDKNVDPDMTSFLLFRSIKDDVTSWSSLFGRIFNMQATLTTRTICNLVARIRRIIKTIEPPYCRAYMKIWLNTSNGLRLTIQKARNVAYYFQKATEPSKGELTGAK
jgi:hypothetical protein